MSKLAKIVLGFSAIIMALFFVSQSLLVFGYIRYDDKIGYIGYTCFILFLPLFIWVTANYIKANNKNTSIGRYSKKLNHDLIEQTRNPVFYETNPSEGAKLLTKQVAESLNADRCSIWLYNEAKTSITCQQLYIKADDTWHQDLELHSVDYLPYFEYLVTDPIIIAHDALTHPATVCFAKSYLIPLGIKSMLDVPIVYRGKTIGVICIESLISRTWLTSEVNFAQLLSSIYTFTYSIKESNDLIRRNKETESFIAAASIISITDECGKITYVNKKFEDVSGWTLDEVIGKDHSIVNSGLQPDGYWANMYKTVMAGEVWNDTVTNVTKNGELYYVDTYIRARFDKQGKLEGFSSIRQDLTEVIKNAQEIEKKNTYLEHAAKILRHDMHSGINTYMPRGINSLERRLNDETIRSLKLEAPLKMIKEGLIHTQKVYKGVYEFTNLVKKDVVLDKIDCDLKRILESYLNSTSYKSQVIIEELGINLVNEALFCTAIDNLIRNGLKYNDSPTKFVRIFIENNELVIQDNGRGLTQEDFIHLSKPYIRKSGQTETGSGLGLNICVAILTEHGFTISCDKNDIGTKIKINMGMRND